MIRRSILRYLASAALIPFIGVERATATPPLDGTRLPDYDFEVRLPVVRYYQAYAKDGWLHYNYRDGLFGRLQPSHDPR